MSIPELTPEQQRFIEDVSQLLVPWGMPIAAARLYVFLLLTKIPVTLDEIAEALGISKSGASTAAQYLLGGGIARRIGEPGSKRIRYEVQEDPGPPLKRHADLLGQMAAMIENRRHAVADGEQADRLGRLAQFHLALKVAMETVL